LNETKLKDLLVSSLESGRILNNNGDSISFVNPGDEIRIKNEAYFGQFDLVIAVLSRTKKQFEFASLSNQIINAILTFGRSIVVLDEKHVTKSPSGFCVCFLQLLSAIRDEIITLESYPCLSDL